jgi:LmbE family N-acetylglucosaminyl deacetylase
MIDLLRARRVLTVFAHPDDETLAAGATIAKLARLGSEIHVVIPATGIYARRNREDVSSFDAALAKLRADCTTAMGCLGISDGDVTFGEFADNEMDGETLLTIIHWLQDIFDRFKPDLVLTHCKECTNVDHQICFEAVTVITRPGLGFNVPVMCGEVPSSTGYRRPTMFEPNVYIEVSTDDIVRKIRSMQSYAGEARPDPHPRSPEVLRALAKVRGSESGFHWAEAFMLLRAFG